MTETANAKSLLDLYVIVDGIVAGMNFFYLFFFFFLACGHKSCTSIHALIHMLMH